MDVPGAKEPPNGHRAPVSRGSEEGLLPLPDGHAGAPPVSIQPNDPKTAAHGLLLIRVFASFCELLLVTHSMQSAPTFS